MVQVIRYITEENNPLDARNHRSPAYSTVEIQNMLCTRKHIKDVVLNLLSIHPEGGNISKRLGGKIGFKVKNISWDSNEFANVSIIEQERQLLCRNFFLGVAMLP